MEVLPRRDGRALTAERSEERTLGVQTDLRRGLQAGVTAYAKNLSNLAYEESPAYFANGGVGHAQGLETWLRFEPQHRPLRASLSYAWTATRERDPRAWRRMPNYYARSTKEFWGPVYENPYWYRPFEDEPHRLGLDAEVRLSRWLFGVRYQLGSGRTYTPVQYVATDPLGSRYGIVGRRGTARLPVYERLDLRVLRQLRTRGVPWSVYADILNATGADNILQYRYSPSYTTRYAVRMLPTLPTLGIEAHF
jgi:hypothetical protein